MRHVYLYAKGHYERSPAIFADLKKIVAHETATDLSYVTTADVFDVVVNLTMKQIPRLANPGYWFKNLIYSIHPDNWWKVGMHEDPTIPKDASRVPEVIVRNCLSILADIKVSMIDGDLGDPDPKSFRSERRTKNEKNNQKTHSFS